MKKNTQKPNKSNIPGALWARIKGQEGEILVGFSEKREKGVCLKEGFSKGLVTESEGEWLKEE